MTKATQNQTGQNQDIRNYPFRVFQGGFNYTLSVAAKNKKLAVKRARHLAGHNGVAAIRQGNALLKIQETDGVGVLCPDVIICFDNKEYPMKDPVYTFVCAVGVCAVIFSLIAILEWRYSQIDLHNQEVGSYSDRHYIKDNTRG